VIKAKGKIRRERLDAEAEALKEHDEAVLKAVKKAPSESKARDEAESYEVVAILAAEIQEVYAETGFQLDDVNANDKALVIWRDLKYRHHVRTHHREIPYRLCEEHS
jgi:hypothetical protein